LEGVGISISALLFALIEFGLLTSQVIYYRNLKSKSMKRFIGVTSLFVLYNVYYLLSALGVFHVAFSSWLYLLNSAAIAVFLLVISYEEFKESKAFSSKLVSLIWIVLISVISMELIHLYPKSFAEMKTVISIGLPVILSLSVLSLIVGVLRAKNKVRGLNWTLYTLPILIIVVSYSVYFRNSLLWFVIVTNFMFVAFAIVKYVMLFAQLKDVNRTYAQKTDILDTFDLTKTQKEITLLILDGKSYEEIAEERHIGYSTVTSHTSKIFDKVGVNSKEKLIAKLTDNYIK